MLVIFTEGKEVLFDGQSVTAQSFPSVVDPDNAQLRPKAIQFANNSLLDHLLAIINLVRLIGLMVI